MLHFYIYLRHLLLVLGLSLGTLLTAQAQTATCPAPTLIGVTSITPTSVSVAFTTSPTATTYTVIYAPPGVNPNVGLTATGTTSPITLTGLTSNTSYSVYVQATCGSSGQSTLAGPLNFLTSCAFITAYPYFENFDGRLAPALPCGYTILDANTDGKGWASMVTSANSAPNAMRNDYSALNAADDWFFTGGFVMQASLTYQLQFKYRAFSNSYNEALEVKIGPAATPAGQTRTLFTKTGIQNTAYVTTVAGGLTNQVLSFTPPTNGVYYFGFHAISPANQFYLYVDDILVDISIATATKSSAAAGFRAEASPVPFGEQLTVQLTTQQAGSLQLLLHDAMGRVVRQHSATVPAGASSVVVPEVSTLPAGMYLLTVRQGDNTQVIRVAHN